MAWVNPRNWTNVLVNATHLNEISDSLNAVRNYMLGADDLGANWKISTGRELLFTDPDVAHGMTTVVATDVYAQIRARHPTLGGMQVLGASDGDMVGLQLTGVVGSTTPTFGAVGIIAHKMSGTGTQALAAAELAIWFQNFGTVMGGFLGDGSFYNGDVNFKLRYESSTETRLQFDANDYFKYDRTTNILSFLVGGSQVLSMIGGALSVTGGFAATYVNLNGTAAVSGAITLTERTDPAIADTDQAYLYIRDNGSGKGQLCIRYHTGAGRVLDTEA